MHERLALEGERASRNRAAPLIESAELYGVPNGAAGDTSGLVQTRSPSPLDHPDTGRWIVLEP